MEKCASVPDVTQTKRSDSKVRGMLRIVTAAAEWTNPQIGAAAKLSAKSARAHNG